MYFFEEIFVALGMSFEEFQLQDQGDSSLNLQGLQNQQFAIYVSFAEIYNEFIYDLLVETPARGRHRPSLKISQDKHQNYYIKGLQEYIHASRLNSSFM